MRKKIKAFLHILINSLLPLEDYYKKIPKTRLLFSFKYFLTLIFILNFILWLSFIIKNFIFTNSLAEFQAGLIKSLNEYPQDLIITVKNNRLTTNFDRPYIFWLNYQNIPHPILVIDERATKDKVYQYDSTTILINSDGVIRRTVAGLRYYPFKIESELIINKERVDNLKNLILRFFKLSLFFIPIILVLLFIVLFIFFSLVKVFCLAIISFFSLIVIKMFHIKTHYKKLFQISLHSNTVPLIYEFAILILITIGQQRFFFYYLFLTLVFFAAAIHQIYFHQTLKTSSYKIHHKIHLKKHRL